MNLNLGVLNSRYPVSSQTTDLRFVVDCVWISLPRVRNLCVGGSPTKGNQFEARKKEAADIALARVWNNQLVNRRANHVIFAITTLLLHHWCAESRPTLPTERRRLHRVLRRSWLSTSHWIARGEQFHAVYVHRFFTFFPAHFFRDTHCIYFKFFFQG